MNAKTAMRALRPTSGAGAPPPALLAPLRRLGRVLFYRSPRFRLALVAAGWPWLRARLPRVAHLAFYDEFAFGPVQRDEALVLHALVRDVRPRTVVEIGFQGGLSSFNFLRALEPDATLYAFDISDFSEETARDAFAAFPNFRFRRKSQDEIEAADVDFRPIDLVFLDASHELELNARTFERLVGLISDRAIIVIHDTGTWHRAALQGAWADLTLRNDFWVSPDEYAPVPQEREFMNWLSEHHAEFAQVHLHSARTVRHGLTLLQRTGRLSVPADTHARASAACQRER